MWSGGFVWKHFKNNTLCFGDSFQAASSHYGCERWGRQSRPQCGVRPLLFNLSSTPWRPPPSRRPLSTYSSIFSPIHQAHQQQQYALKRREAPLFLLTQCVLCCLSGAWQWLHKHIRKLYQISGVQKFLFVFNQFKLLSEKLWSSKLYPP